MRRTARCGNTRLATEEISRFVFFNDATGGSRWICSVDQLIDRSFDRSIVPLIGWLIDWSIVRSSHWLIDWLIELRNVQWFEFEITESHASFRFFLDCLFRICPMNRYTAQNQFRKSKLVRQQTVTSSASPPSTLMNKLHVRRRLKTGWVLLFLSDTSESVKCNIVVSSPSLSSWSVFVSACRGDGKAPERKRKQEALGHTHPIRERSPGGSSPKGWSVSINAGNRKWRQLKLTKIAGTLYFYVGMVTADVVFFPVCLHFCDRARLKKSNFKLIFKKTFTKYQVILYSSCQGFFLTLRVVLKFIFGSSQSDLGFYFVSIKFSL